MADIIVNGIKPYFYCVGELDHVPKEVLLKLWEQLLPKPNEDLDLNKILIYGTR